MSNSIKQNQESSFRRIQTYKEDFHDDYIVKKLTYRSFGKTGIDVSLLGFGGSALALCYNTPNEKEAIETVVTAIKSGINYIDTAPFYGQGKAELVLGKALKLIPRDTYYLATKVGRYGPDTANMFDFSAERTMRSVEESLQRLGVSSFDVLQVHDLEFAPNMDMILNETLPALQRLKDEGKTKYIGITGYPVSLLKEIVEKSPVKIDVVLSYCRCTLFDDTLQSYIPYFKEKNVAIINAAVLGMGLFTNFGPPDWHPADPTLKEICHQAVGYCKQKNVNISKLAAYYAFSQPGIDVHLIGMKNKTELEVHLDAFINKLTPDEMSVFAEVYQKYFKGLSVHWENKEIQKYWEKMKKL